MMSVERESFTENAARLLARRYAEWCDFRSDVGSAEFDRDLAVVCEVLGEGVELAAVVVARIAEIPDSEAQYAEYFRVILRALEGEDAGS